MNLQYISDKNGNPISIVIPIDKWEIIKQKYKGIETSFDIEEPSKEEIKHNIRQGLRELKLIEEGKVRSRSAKEFLNEL
jgi:hypothetical protein